MVDRAYCKLLSVILSLTRLGVGAESLSGDPAIVITSTSMRLVVLGLDPIRDGFNLIGYYHRLRRYGVWDTAKQDLKRDLEIFLTAPRWVQIPFSLIAASSLFHWYHPVGIVLGAVLAALLLSVLVMSMVVAVRRA